jgi:hypothetical protein
VLDEGFVVAAGIEESISQDCKPGVVQGAFRQLALFVDGLADAKYGAVIPG